MRLEQASDFRAPARPEVSSLPPPGPGLMCVFLEIESQVSDLWSVCPTLSPGEVHSFEAMDSDPEQARTLDAQCPVSQLLQLKLGAQVSGKWGLPDPCPSVQAAPWPEDPPVATISSFPPVPAHLPVFYFPLLPSSPTWRSKQCCFRQITLLCWSWVSSSLNSEKGTSLVVQ